MKKAKHITTTTAEELAHALGLTSEDAFRWEMQIYLTQLLRSIIKESKLTHAAVAKKAKTSRSRVTGILNNSISDVSTDLLLRILDSLGYKVSITVSKKKVAA